MSKRSCSACNRQADSRCVPTNPNRPLARDRALAQSDALPPTVRATSSAVQRVLTYKGTVMNVQDLKSFPFDSDEIDVHFRSHFDWMPFDVPEKPHIVATLGSAEQPHYRLALAHKEEHGVRARPPRSRCQSQPLRARASPLRA